MKVKIKFVDFWSTFNERENYFVNKLSKSFDLEFSNNPDFLIYSVYGCEHLNYKCIKILFTGENIIPNFNECDYAIGFHHIQFGTRYLRWPLYLLNESVYKAVKEKHNFDSTELDKKNKFCNFIYSNPNGILRNELFKELSNYKSVDSAGKFLNNNGKPIVDKIKYQSEFKFTIAFENSLGFGYSTEKIMDAFAAKTIPIYWGNPDVNFDFNENSFINVHKFSSLDEVVELVQIIDRDTSLYESYLNCPAIIESESYEPEVLINFFSNIFENKIQFNNHKFISYWQEKTSKESKLICKLRKNIILKYTYKLYQKVRSIGVKN